jgi:adenine-specific DNA-methyltransferase
MSAEVEPKEQLVGQQRLIQGDALSILKERIPDQSVDLVFADPPYNLGKQGFKDSWISEEAYFDWCGDWLESCLEKLKPDGSLYLMNSTQNMPRLDLFIRERMHVLSRIVWSYDSSGVQAKKYFGSLYEPILFAAMDRRNYTFNAESIRVEARTGAKRKLIDYRKNPPAPYKTTKVPGNVWTFPRVRFRMPEYQKHPAQKPEALLERIILASSSPGDVVLDPFAGTFTVAAVSERLGRKSISIEIEDEYFGLGRERVSQSAQGFAAAA